MRALSLQVHLELQQKVNDGNNVGKSKLHGCALVKWKDDEETNQQKAEEKSLSSRPTRKATTPSRRT